MAASKFTDETRYALLDLISDGVSFKDACRQVDVNLSTFKGWLKKGRKELAAGKDSEYAAFAAAIDHAKDSHEQSEAAPDLTAEEMKGLVAKAARQGSVQAMRLYHDLYLRPDDEPDGDEKKDPWRELDGEDEVAQARRKRAQTT